MKARLLQGRYANIKTVLPLSTVIEWITSTWPDASVVGATHDEPNKVKHCHVVVRFVGSVRWNRLATWLHTKDGHEYAAPAGSWRRSVRYLLHLDNPEKCRIPYENLQSSNIDESELSQLLGSQKLPILESLILAETLPLHKRFAFLVVERGHSPSEVSAALRCMLDLERWHNSHISNCLQRESAMPVNSPYPPLAETESDGQALSDDDFGIDFESFDSEIPSDTGP